MSSLTREQQGCLALAFGVGAFAGKVDDHSTGAFAFAALVMIVWGGWLLWGRRPRSAYQAFKLRCAELVATTDWRLDEDDWLHRPIREGETIPELDSSQGFTCEGQVYVRRPGQARALDAGRPIPSDFDD